MHYKYKYTFLNNFPPYSREGILFSETNLGKLMPALSSKNMRNTGMSNRAYVTDAYL
jgi:hypothetical protein